MNHLSDQVSLYGDILRISPFRKLLVGQGLSMAGDAICLAALPVALIRADFDVEVFGAVMAAVGAGTVIGAIVGGVLADQKRPKPILVCTDIARGIAQVAATALIFSGAQWWSLTLVYLMFGIGIGVSRPCAQVLMVSLLPRQVLVAGNSAMHLVDNLVAIILPASVGVLVILWNPVWGILIDGVTFFCAAFFTAMLPGIDGQRVDKEFAFRRAFEGFAVIANNATLSLGLFVTLVVNVFCFPVFLVIAPYAISARFSDILWGWCLAASGFGACIGSFTTVLLEGHQRLRTLAVISGVFLTCALAMLGMGVASWIVIMAATLIGIVEAAWLTAWATAMQILSPVDYLGKVVAAETFVTSGLHPLVYLGIGFVGGLIGYPKALLITALISLTATAAIALISLLHVPRDMSR